jgi:response regulator RpfG family c-di-GMP phosphodiesterase
MMETFRLLFVDDEENVLQSLKRVFLDADYSIQTSTSGQEGLSILEAGPPIHVVVSDYRMPRMNGVEFLSMVARKWPDTVRIVLSGYADTPAVIGAINEGGIYKFISKPWNDDELRVAVANAATLYFLQRRIAELMHQVKFKDDEIDRLRKDLRLLSRVEVRSPA